MVIQLGATEIGTPQIGAVQPATAQIGTAQRCTPQAGEAEIAAIEISTIQNGLSRLVRWFCSCRSASRRSACIRSISARLQPRQAWSWRSWCRSLEPVAAGPVAHGSNSSKAKPGFHLLAITASPLSILSIAVRPQLRPDRTQGLKQFGGKESRSSSSASDVAGRCRAGTRNRSRMVAP